MTTVDPTRPRPGGAPPAETGLDDLVEGAAPLACEACLAAGGECEFHRGWDACAAFVARTVHEQRDAELDCPASAPAWLDDEPDDDALGSAR